MTFARQPHEATDPSQYLSGEDNGVPEGRRFSPKLGRDDRLRREYVRRRWHGLVG
jgi:hypothetical protein